MPATEGRRPVRLGIIGLGNVGGGTLRILADNASLITRRLGRELEVAAICSRSVRRNAPEPAAIFPKAARETDWRQVVDDPEIDIVAELVGGLGVAAEIIETAISRGKSVVTANKELMALDGARLWELARRSGVRLAMEASVAGGIPIHTVLREGIAGDRVQALLGILNGTCNFILTEMEQRGESLDVILAEAQAAGYAEADPSADIDGHDARSKLALLAALAFGSKIAPESIPTEGIRRIRNIDFQYAAKLDRTVRLVASAVDSDDGLYLSVRPAMLPKSTILASVSGSYNAVWVRGAHGEDTFYYGRGAGPTPTGVAVVSDLMAVAREISGGAPERVSPFAYSALDDRLPADIDTEHRPYYLRFRVKDKPGIIADLARILAESDISIEAVLQEPSCDRGDLPFVITTEAARRSALREALKTMEGLDFLVDKPLALPLERGLEAE